MNREELFIETDAVKRNITRMMFTDDIEELCELLCATNITISRIFKENLKLMLKEIAIDVNIMANAHLMYGEQAWIKLSVNTMNLE